MKAHTVAMALLVGLSVGGEAMGRSRSSRDGFNFGTTVRLLGGNDRTLAGAGEDRDTHEESTSQLVNPYIGYSFGALNLGLMYSAESRTSSRTERSADGATETQRDSSLASKGASIFTRFLFGSVFFFEGGVGAYEEKLKVHTETKTYAEGGSFTGSSDEYEMAGVGPGYHVGGGLELPMGGGFYFSSAYQVRMIQLREHAGGNDLGRKRSQTQKREVLFGIAFYDR